jgi:hypothetical protein
MPVTYNVVPLAGSCGAQKVEGKRDAMDIASYIANRERTTVAVTPDRPYARQTLVKPS